jgi:hypothetical protein
VEIQRDPAMDSELVQDLAAELLPLVVGILILAIVVLAVVL